MGLKDGPESRAGERRARRLESRCDLGRMMRIVVDHMRTAPTTQELEAAVHAGEGCQAGGDGFELQAETEPH